MAAIKRFAHEHEIPFARADFVDEIFPRLRRQTLTEVRAQTINALAALVRGRAVGVAGLVEPVEHVVGKISPDVLRDRVEVTIAAAGTVFAADAAVEPIAFILMRTG